MLLCEMKYNIILGDCLEQMARLPSKSIDLVFTSPPYNLGTSSGGGLKNAGPHGKWTNALLVDGYNGFDDKLSVEQYTEWQKENPARIEEIIEGESCGPDGNC